PGGPHRGPVADRCRDAGALGAPGPGATRPAARRGLVATGLPGPRWKRPRDPAAGGRPAVAPARADRAAVPARVGVRAALRPDPGRRALHGALVGWERPHPPRGDRRRGP